MRRQQQMPSWQLHEQQQREGLMDSFKKGSKWIAKNVLPVLGVASGSAGYAAAGLAAGKAATDAAKPPAAVPMPDEQDLERARRRSIAAQLGRTGRQSTILSSSTDETLG